LDLYFGGGFKNGPVERNHIRCSQQFGDGVPQPFALPSRTRDQESRKRLETGAYRMVRP
jgi:hypothetical protein